VSPDSSGTIGSSSRSALRSTAMVVRAPIRSVTSKRCRSSIPETACPSKPMMMSPDATPARAAALSGSTPVTSTPLFAAVPNAPLRQPEQWNVLSRDSDAAAADLAVADQLAGHDFRRIDAHCEADPLGGKDHRRVHADYAAPARPPAARPNCPGSKPRRSGSRRRSIAHPPSGTSVPGRSPRPRSRCSGSRGGCRSRPPADRPEAPRSRRTRRR